MSMVVKLAMDHGVGINISSQIPRVLQDKINGVLDKARYLPSPLTEATLEVCLEHTMFKELKLAFVGGAAFPKLVMVAFLKISRRRPDY